MPNCPNLVQYHKRSSSAGLSKDCADFCPLEIFVHDNIDSENEVALNQNDILGIFCLDRADETNVNIKTSKVAFVNINKNISSLSNRVNQTEEALFEPVNVSHPHQISSQCLTPGSIEEEIASNPNKKGSKSPSKRANFNLPDSVRRSTRKKMRPLAAWKSQRCLHGFNEAGEHIFLGIFEGLKEIEDIPRTMTVQKNIKPVKRKYKRVKKCSKIDHIPVLDKRTDSNVCAEIVMSRQVLHWDSFSHLSKGADYQIAKTFDSKSISFGFLELFAHQVKPEQCSPEKNIYYCVVRGTVKVELNKNLFLAQDNESFIVPCGNKYEITNVCQGKTVLIFCLFKAPILNNLRLS